MLKTLPGKVFPQTLPRGMGLGSRLGARLDIVAEFVGERSAIRVLGCKGVQSFRAKAIATLPWLSVTDGMSWKREEYMMQTQGSKTT